MFVAAVVTMIQLYPIWRVGAGLPIVMGASLIGSIFEIIFGFFIKPLRKLFPPIVTSLVIISIGLSLLPVGIQYFGGGSGATYLLNKEDNGKRKFIAISNNEANI